MTSLRSRYAKALRLTAPKLAAETPSLADTQTNSVTALFSPDGRYACFVKGHDLWLKEQDSGVERALTTDGAVNNSYGQISETGASIVSYRQHPSPVGLWSPDSQWFLTHRIDERPLPESALIQHSPPGGGRPILHRFKYVLPGDPMPQATYVAIHIPSGRAVKFDDFTATITAFSPFFLRMAWFSAVDTAWVVRFDRYCKQVDLIRLDLNRGTSQIVLTETAEAGYLDLHPIAAGTPNVRTLTESDEIIWFSQADGWGHLYLYDSSTGQLKNQITSGAWQVRDIVHVDEKKRTILFLAGGIRSDEDPARRSLCSASLDGGGFEVLLSHDGDIFVPKTEPCGLDQNRPFHPANASSGVSPDGRFAIVQYSSVERGNVIRIVDLQTRDGFVIAAAHPLPGEVQARHFNALAADGETRLYGVMFLPSDFNERQRYPLIVYIYPGPQVANQPQSYRSVNAAQAMALAELGFVTLMLDTRGMPVGSRAFHHAGYGSLLEPQLADHAAVVSQLCKRHSFIDGARVGIIGYSAGGAAAARALFDYGDIFKVGVSACGNHDSSLFSAFWSDKYRGPPGCEAWTEQANQTAAHKLKGKLLLISGDMDQSVSVSQTLSLADALIRANKDFDLLIVPNEGHWVLSTSGYAQRRVWDYFVRHLLGETPPADFEIRFEPHELVHFMKAFMREARQ
jgi:dipeptidyl aminopeptidase/acylaminoacyl peptidase